MTVVLISNKAEARTATKLLTKGIGIRRIATGHRSTAEEKAGPKEE